MRDRYIALSTVTSRKTVDNLFDKIFFFFFFKETHRPRENEFYIFKRNERRRSCRIHIATNNALVRLITDRNAPIRGRMRPVIFFVRYFDKAVIILRRGPVLAM